MANLPINKRKVYSKKLISLRDYEVHEGIKKGGIDITLLTKHKWTWTAAELQTMSFQCHKRFIKSKLPFFRNPLSGMNGFEMIDFKIPEHILKKLYPEVVLPKIELKKEEPIVQDLFPNDFKH